MGQGTSLGEDKPRNKTWKKEQNPRNGPACPVLQQDWGSWILVVHALASLLPTEGLKPKECSPQCLL